MKRFQQLILEESQNQYGLKYNPIINSNKPLKNIIKNDNEKNIKKVQIYVKSCNKKSTKIKVQRPCEISVLKQILHLKTQIQPQDQILYLNGRQISEYFSINFNQSQILHLSNRKSIVNQNQNITVHAQISVPAQISHNGQKICFYFKGGDKLKKLQQSIVQKITISNPQNSLAINFLESGRILDKEKTFNENTLTTQCNIVCLYSQNFIQTKFLNQFCQTFPQKIKDKFYENNFQIRVQEASQKTKNDENSFQSFKFKKTPLNTKNFFVEKPKNNIYTRIERKSQLTPHSSDLKKPTMQKRRSEAASMQFGTSGFKKKRIYTEDQKSQDSNLITKIVVRKSKKQIQKMFTDNSLLPQNIHEEEEKKSFVSSSSSQDNGKEYIPIRQQKQYRPCPLIPQRKMPQSQKMKINLQLQKLFGLQPKNLLSSSNDESQQNKSQNHSNPQKETAKTRLMMKNPNMRSSISAKQSMIKALKDRKSNRYAEQKMYQGD